MSRHVTKDWWISHPETTNCATMKNSQTMRSRGLNWCGERYRRPWMVVASK